MADLEQDECWVVLYPYHNGEDHGIDFDTISRTRLLTMLRGCEQWCGWKRERKDGEDVTTWRQREWRRLYRKGWRVAKRKLVEPR